MQNPDLPKIKQTLQSVAREYPAEMVQHQLKDVDRIAFHIELVVKAKGTAVTICDIGGGIGLFSVGCAALGMKSILVDDFRDEGNRQMAPAVLELHKSHGVEVVNRDVVGDGIDFPPASLDVVTSFDSMEHWHHSPKRLFAAVRAALRPGGFFLLCGPNCVNLRKRISVPLGSGKWTTMKDWYETDVFRAHVREPDVDDLKYIARDMRLQNVRVHGRNWLGYHSRRPLIRAVTPLMDRMLRLFPTLCSDIYITGNV